MSCSSIPSSLTIAVTLFALLGCSDTEANDPCDNCQPGYVCDGQQVCQKLCKRDDDCGKCRICEEGLCAGIECPNCVPAQEGCSDSVDNDCDGRIDCDDKDCANLTKCGGTCTVTTELCADNSDNDCDRLVDCDDVADCGGHPACACVPSDPPLEVCDDGRDNDCNGVRDCSDSICLTSPACCSFCLDGARTVWPHEVVEFAPIGGVPPYTFVLASGGGRIEERTGVYVAQGTPGFEVVEVFDSQGARADATITVAEVFMENIKINRALAVGGLVRAAATTFTPNHGRVIYTAEQETDDRMEVYVSDADGGGNKNLSNPEDPEASGGSARVTADNELVVYKTLDDTQLRSVPIVGGPSSTITPDLLGGKVLAWRLSPDAVRRQMVFQASFGTEAAQPLFSAPITGGSLTQISADWFKGNSINSAWFYTPDGGAVIYWGKQGPKSAPGLWRASIGVDRAPVGLVDDRYVSSTAKVSQVQLSGSGQRIVCRVDAGGRSGLYSMELDGSQWRPLHVPGLELLGFESIVGKDQVLMKQGSAHGHALYRVAPSGGVVTRVSDEYPQIGDWVIAEDGSFIAFAATRTGGGPWEIMATDLSGDGVDSQVTAGDIDYDGRIPAVVSGFYRRVIYRLADQAGVRSVEMDGTAPTTITSFFDQERGALLVTPDGKRLIFSHDPSPPKIFNLWATNPLGLTPARRINPRVAGFGGGAWVAGSFTPDGQRFVYLWRQDDAQVYELYIGATNGM